MKLTKSLLESLIREAIEEAGCRGKDLEEGNCAGKRDDDVLEEEQEGEKKKSKKVKNPGKYEKKSYDKDGDGVPDGADSKPEDGSES